MPRAPPLPSISAFTRVFDASCGERSLASHLRCEGAVRGTLQDTEGGKGSLGSRSPLALIPTHRNAFSEACSIALAERIPARSTSPRALRCRSRVRAACSTSPSRDLLRDCGERSLTSLRITERVRHGRIWRSWMDAQLRR